MQMRSPVTLPSIMMLSTSISSWSLECFSFGFTGDLTWFFWQASGPRRQFLTFLLKKMVDCKFPRAQVPGGWDWCHAGPLGEALLPCEASRLPSASRRRFSDYSTSLPSRFSWGILESIMENRRFLPGGLAYLSSLNFYLRLVNMNKLCSRESVTFFVPDSNLTFEWLKEGNNSRREFLSLQKGWNHTVHRDDRVPPAAHVRGARVPQTPAQDGRTVTKLSYENQI